MLSESLRQAKAPLKRETSKHSRRQKDSNCMGHLMRGDSVESLDAGSGRPFTGRTVHAFKPLSSASGYEVSKTNLSRWKHQVEEATKTGTTEVPQLQATEPRPIPAARPSLESRQVSAELPGAEQSITKSWQADLPHAERQQTAYVTAKLPILLGSWTQRQIQYPLDDPARQPKKVINPFKIGVEGKHATPDSDKAKAKAAIPDWKSKAKEGGTTHAWQVRLKRKWIKEELHKQRRDFPDDPDYEDEWEHALNLIETCGPLGALQAAFLEAKNTKAPEDEDVLDENVLFDYDNESPSRFCKPLLSSEAPSIAGKAATLLRMHYEVAAA